MVDLSDERPERPELEDAEEPLDEVRVKREPCVVRPTDLFSAAIVKGTEVCEAA